EAAEAAAAKIADLEAQLAAEKANVKTVEVPGPTVIVEVPGDTPNTKDASKVTTSVKVSAQAFKKGTKPKVTVQITIPGGDARGRVALFVNGKKVKTMNVIRSKITVTLPKKYTKAIKVKAKYAPKLPKYGTTKTSATKKITTK
ncbi:MAG: hypothetical protein LBR20_01620, partial [Propionibacteriaceae bacterium]|nr:hypothetical protein [Propionibacteriaceae bacterium]